MTIDLSARNDELRYAYRPPEVRLLFVGESAPAGGTFFYAEDSKLFFATREAFEDAIPEAASGSFARWFANHGCYLDDLCRIPVNHENPRERRAARREGQEGLAARLSGMRPRHVVIVMKDIEANVRAALHQASISAPTSVLPFPAMQWRSAYVRALSELVRGWSDSGLLSVLHDNTTSAPVRDVDPTR